MSDILARILAPVGNSNMDDLRQCAQEALQDLVLKDLSESGFSDKPSSTAGLASACCTA